MKTYNFRHQSTFELELGETLPELNIQYSTAGNLNNSRNNVVWVFHALTANSNPFEWWGGLFGLNKFFSPDEHYIVCANVLGGCYGTTGPLSDELPKSNQELNFPKITIKDIVKAHELLAEYLKISEVKFAIGGSFGGYQAIEFSLGRIPTENLILIATSAVESPWNIAIHETQRLAIKSDSTLNKKTGGKKGLEAARGIGLLTYRTPNSFNINQPREINQTEQFRASSYIQHQGNKLSKRFSPFSYLTLLNCLDTHDISRNRGTLGDALSLIDSKVLCIGIEEDLLASSKILESQCLQIPNGHFELIQSDYGHDGFLLETEKITQLLIKHFNEKN